MYTYCRTIHPATTVDHSIYCNFFDVYEKQLVIASGNELKVYRLLAEQISPVSPPISANFISADSDEEPSKETKTESKITLECVKSITLHAQVCCLKCVRLSGSARDSLLLSFEGWFHQSLESIT